ncbi:class I SAM-dependent methyltransferase [Amnibacterium endophyticum]|uniref:Class I SAM-dependent methyltransferase n=1 Tax=Amnibacterium endophyticum TaxID=2109337 RepID=A0ABW4LEX1_9MICO
MQFPPGFFARDDESADTRFYRAPRLVTHIDAGAIDAVGALYEELGVSGRVLDLMSSWVSHLRATPEHLAVLGLNRAELDANPQAAERVVQDLNEETALPFPDGSFDAVLCCVSIDYLVRPVAVLAEAARVLRPGAPVVLTFSNRLFPTKAVRGWLLASEDERCAIAAEYLRQAGGFTEPEASLRTPPGPDRGGRYGGDPLYAVVARRR